MPVLALLLHVLATTPTWSLTDALWHVAAVRGFPAIAASGLLRRVGPAANNPGAETRVASLRLAVQTRGLLEDARAWLELHPTSTLTMAVVQAADERWFPELIPLALFGLPPDVQGTDAVDEINAVLKRLGTIEAPPPAAPTEPAPPLPPPSLGDLEAALGYLHRARAVLLYAAEKLGGAPVDEAEAYALVNGCEALARRLNAQLDAAEAAAREAA